MVIFQRHKMSKALNDLLTNLASRFNVRDEKIFRKTKELLALLNSKQQLSCSDTCKTVICLELASSLSSSPLNREEAIKYSGCKRRIYNNYYNNVSKLLNLDKIYSVKEICLLLGVSDIQEPTNKLFEKYKSVYIENNEDFEHPMYSCAAVLAFCRGNKIKINTTKLVEFSRIKKSELEELSEKFLTLIEVKKTKKTSEPKSKTSNFKTVSNMEAIEIAPSKKKANTGVMTDEEYEKWKRKMLED